MSNQLTDLSNEDWDELRLELLIKKITDLICDEGLNREKILQLIVNNHEFDLTEEEANELIDEAVRRLIDLYNTPEYKHRTLKEHIAIYEHIYAYFKRINHAQGANKALQAKEKLLNILKEGNRVTLKRSETIIHESESLPEYDRSKLTPVEQKRMEELLNKALA